jgi:hypothetical protein
VAALSGFGDRIPDLVSGGHNCGHNHMGVVMMVLGTGGIVIYGCGHDGLGYGWDCYIGDDQD